MVKTKKVGLTGRFGPRYGRRVKVEIEKIERKQKALYTCPVCKRKSLRRSLAGIWICKMCNAKLAGGAYTPVTEIKESE